MLAVREGKLNIRLTKLGLDHFIDAALLLLLFMLFTFDHAEVGLSALYYVSYFLFVGFTFVKVLVRIRVDGTVKLSGIALWYLAFALFSAATSFWSDYPEVLLEAAVRMLQIILLLFCISQTYATQQGIVRCLKLVSWAATLDVLYIFIMTPPDEWFNGYFGMELTGQNANVIGMILTVTTMITAYFAYYCKQRVYYISLALQVFAALLTSSRKTFVAICMGFIMLIFLKDRSVKLLFRILFVTLAIIAVIYAIMNIPQLYLAIGQRFESMLNYLTDTDVDNSMYMRRMFIYYAKQFFAEHPILGNGPNSFALRIVDILGESDYAHNNYYEILVSYGIVGFMLYYGMYAYIVAKLIKAVVVSENGGAKLMLTVMTVILICEYGIVLYYSVYAMVFLSVAFMFVCAYDNSLRRPPSLNRNNRYKVREDDIKWI